MMLQVCLLLAVSSLLQACEFNGTKRANGEHWVSKDAFIMKCTISDDLSWRAEIIGCQTRQGTIINEGEERTEEEITYTCKRGDYGTMHLQRTYGSRGAANCEGHKTGESWIVRENFNKTCTNNGTRILNCFTDSGAPIALNSKLVEGKITFSCDQRPNGTVVLSRRTEPISGTVKQSELSEGKIRPTEVISGDVVVKKSVTCNVDGDEKKPGETWLENGRFQKKCDKTGAIVIEKCVLDDTVEIDLNSQIERDGKNYICKELTNGTVWFRIEPIE